MSTFLTSSLICSEKWPSLISGFLKVEVAMGITLGTPSGDTGRPSAPSLLIHLSSFWFDPCAEQQDHLLGLPPTPRMTWV